MIAVMLSSASLAEEFIVGGAEHPWVDSGVTPGGVIAFVDDIHTLVEAEQVLFSTESQLPGWMLPVRVDPGVNISIGLLARGGKIDINLSANQKDQAGLAGVINGDHRVAIDRKPVDGGTIQNNGIIISVDLGARFGVNRILFYPRMSDQFPFANEFMRGYELYINDGQPENLFASGQPNFVSPVSREPDNADTTVIVDIDAQFVRFLQLKSIINAGFEIDEIEIYGTGFVPEASYESFPLSMDGPSVWGQIRWLEAIAGDPRDSSIEVRARTGSDDTPDVFIRQIKTGGVITGQSTNDLAGNPLTRASYERLLREGQSMLIQTDAENWGQWQLVDNGQILELPAPRQYLQFRVDFSNATLGSSRALAQLAFDFAVPPVDALVAEVEPAVARISESTTFTFVTRVDNRSGRAGFSRFDVETPARATAVHSVILRDAAGGIIAQSDFGSIMVNTPLPLRSGDIALQQVEEDFFSLQIPRVQEDGASIEIVFDSAVFRYGTRFRGRAFSEGADLPLLTEGGDATAAIETDDLLVRVAIGSTVVGPLDVSPQSFSPNNDGINDETLIEYIVQHLVALSPVTVDVHDLSGRRIRRLENTEKSSGKYRVVWDGRNDEGTLVPPGLYLIAVEIQSDEGRQRRLRQTAVIY